MTNYERIKNMTVEEIAETISSTVDDCQKYCKFTKGGKCNAFGDYDVSVKWSTTVRGMWTVLLLYDVESGLLISFMRDTRLEAIKHLKAAKPALFSDAVDLLLDNKVFTQKEFVDELSEMGLAMNPSELEVLLNLSKGTLSVQNTEPVKMVMLKPKE